MRVLACVLAAVAALQSQPAFRTGVELIRVDVTVLDKAGQPVTGVGPEVRRTGDDAVLASVPAPIATTELPGRRIAAGTIPATALQAGSCTVSAMVLVNGRPIGKVSRAITPTP